MSHWKSATAVAVALHVWACTSSAAWAQSPVRAPAAPPGEAEVRQASAAYVKALNAGDFKAAAAFWTAKGEFIDAAGNSVLGQKLIGEELARQYAGSRPPKMSLTIGSVRLVTPDTASEDGTVAVGEGDSAVRGRYSVVWVRQQGKWLIHSLRETSGALLAPTHQLAALDWMAGRWQADSPGGSIEMNCHWSPEKAFMLREITVVDADQIVEQISQRIGRDPAGTNFKSWSFDSAGGLAEAVWEPSGANWLVTSRGTSSTGEPTSAHNVYTEIGPQGFTLTSSEAHQGPKDPPAAELRFKRIQPTVSAAPEPANTAGASSTDARAKILNSPEWRETQRAFDQWLSIQKIYTPEEVKAMRDSLRSRIDKMSAAELQTFLADSRDKLSILLGEEAQQARLWLAQRMAVEVNLTPEQIQKLRPDVLNKTPAQLEKWLIQWRQQRTQTQQNQAAFVEGRNTRVQNLDAHMRRKEQARESALDRANMRMMTPFGAFNGGGVNNPGGFGAFRF